MGNKRTVSFILLKALSTSVNILVILFLFFTPLLADIYGYQDAEGDLHFTNAPTNKKFRLIIREKRVMIDPKNINYESLIEEISQKYSLDSNLIKAVIKAESNFNPAAISPKGAAGLMQLMPATAYELKVSDTFHPRENIDGGVRYLKYLMSLFGGNLPLALAAYNAGEGAVQRYNGIPPYKETKGYVERVLRIYHNYKGQGETLKITEDRP